MTKAVLQRKCSCGGQAKAGGECEECKKKRPELQRKGSSAAAAGPAFAPPIVHDVLRSPGRSLDSGTRTSMEKRLGHDFSKVRLHTDERAAESARAVNANAWTVGSHIAFASGRFEPSSTAGRKLLAHELTHVLQQGAAPPASSGPLRIEDAGSSAEREAQSMERRPEMRRAHPILQRDLALTPPENVREQPDLTEAQVQAAIRFNNASYSEESTRLIQDLVGAEQTGHFDETTVRLVAGLQEEFGLEADGKVGPESFDLLIRELQAEAEPRGTCLTLFQIVGPEPVRFFRNTPTTGNISSRFFIRARFDPRCKCEDFEYRQQIRGTVVLNDVSGATFPLNGRFAVPGGLRANRFAEDGDVAIPAGVAGHFYGHRSFRPNPADGRDRYLPRRSDGCEYAGRDFPLLNPVPAAPGDRGDQYVWDLRFRGFIQRRGHGVVAEKYWAVRGTVVIP